MHPSFEVPRVYRVSVDGSIGAAELRKMTEGVRCGDEVYKARNARLLERDEKHPALQELRQGVREIGWREAGNVGEDGALAGALLIDLESGHGRRPPTCRWERCRWEGESGGEPTSEKQGV